VATCGRKPCLVLKSSVGDPIAWISFQSSVHHSVKALALFYQLQAMPPNGNLFGMPGVQYFEMLPRRVDFNGILYNENSICR